MDARFKAAAARAFDRAARAFSASPLRAWAGRPWLWLGLAVYAGASSLLLHKAAPSWGDAVLFDWLAALFLGAAAVTSVRR